jgi:hypothetical protein
MVASDDSANSETDPESHSPPSPLPPLPPLPPLTDTAAVYSGCCLALSTPLIGRLRSLLPASPGLTLSIGSGFGLLEALLLAQPLRLSVVGVEVEPSSNLYLPASNHRVVHGTRFLEPLAAEASTWLFVYPRRVGLLSEYISEYGNRQVDQIIWAGPQADWHDYKDCFGQEWTVQTQGADAFGGRAFEMLAVASRQR